MAVRGFVRRPGQDLDGDRPVLQIGSNLQVMPEPWRKQRFCGD